MIPVFFGPADRPLFGAYHPAGGAAASRSRRGVVLCYPHGREYQFSHRAFVQLADLLAASGIHAMRFDYSATGDSAGDAEEASLELWLEDVGEAAEELAVQADLEAVSLLGLRVGALVAAAALEEDSVGVDVDHLVLWSPVVSGKRWYERQVARHRERVGEDPARVCPHAVEVMGYLVSDPVRLGLEELDLTAMERVAEVRTTLLGRAETDEHVRLRDALEARGAPAAFVENPSADDWDRLDRVGAALLPRRAMDEIVASLGGGA